MTNAEQNDIWKLRKLYKKEYSFHVTNKLGKEFEKLRAKIQKLETKIDLAQNNNSVKVWV